MTKGTYKIKHDNLDQSDMLVAEVDQKYVDGKLIGVARALTGGTWTGWAPLTFWRTNGWNTWIREGK